MNKIAQLERDLLKHKILYYQGKSEISDEQYDLLESELKSIDPENKILSVVGTPVVDNKIKHDYKMLSLNKTYSFEELIRWKEDKDIVSTFKIDGSSCSLIYINGKLTLAKTRGDGLFGENITKKILHICSIPKTIQTKSLKVEIRGEVFCTESQFIHLCDEMVSLNLEKPTSQRNIVAGLLGRKENIQLAKFLNFQAFELMSDEVLKTETDKFNYLKDNNFDIPEVIVHRDRKSLEAKLEDTKEFIEAGEYLIDGIVFTYNELTLHEELGSTAHHPRYKMAYKFQGETKIAEVSSITWQVSRNGILTPVAEIIPVELSGAKISRVTLHNYAMVREFKLKSGDKIEIVRSGEVIPKFLSVKQQSSKPYEVPTNCPSCKTLLKEEDIRLICENKNCPERKLEEVTYFVQKIGIDDLSRKRIQEMVNANLISDVSDLYRITIDQLLALDKTKEKMANKIHSNIEKTKKVDLIVFLTSLGISGGGYNKCEKIVFSGFNSIEKVTVITVDQLREIEGFAEKSSNEFYHSLNSKMKLITNLLRVGLEPKSNVEVQKSSITGLKFCITGSLNRKRSEIEKDIKTNGGGVVTSVTKNTSFLVTNDTESSSSKFKKAEELEIPIITEAKLLEIINEGKN